MYVGHHVKYPLLLSNFNDAWITSIYFEKKIPISNFMKIRPLGAELFRAGGRADGRTEWQADRCNEDNTRVSKFCERV
jgi:hypothetical protein